MTYQTENVFLLRGWGLAMMRYVAAGLFGFLWIITVTRSLEPSQAGVVILVSTLPPLLAPVVDLGIPIAIAYLVAGERYGKGQIKGWVAWIVRRVVLAGVALFVIAVAMLAIDEGPTQLSYVVLGLAAVPFAVGITLLAAYYRGTRQFARHAVLTAAPYALLAGSTLAAVMFDISDTAFFVTLVVAAYATPCLIAAVRFGLSTTSERDDREALVRSAWAYSWKLYVSEAASAIRVRVDLVMVAIFLGTTSAAIFGSAAAVGAQLAIVSLAANLVVFPYVAGRVAGGDRGVETTGLVSRSSFALTVLATLFVVLLGPGGFAFVFGDQFSESWAVFAAYAPGVIALSAARVVTADLMARGAVTSLMRISLSTAVLGVALLAGGIVGFGILGAALATSLTAIVNTASRVFVLTRMSSAGPADFFRLRVSDLSTLRSALARNQPG